MNIATFLAQRLHNHRITGAQFASPHQAVAWFGAMQAQDYPHSKWAAGLRCTRATDADVEQAIATGSIVRTWAMRGTLQLVAVEDMRWMLSLVATRLIKSQAASDMKRFELDEGGFDQAEHVLTAVLRGGKQLTRAQVYAVLEQHGIATTGQRGYHILWHAGLRGLICQGAPQGKLETFTLQGDWLPPTKPLTREAALAGLALRYFRSHGPATLKDFVWWSGLTVSEARAGLDGSKAKLTQDIVDGAEYWLPNDATPAKAQSPDVHLLPGFDEYLLGYTDRSLVLQHVHNASVIHSNGIFKPTVVVDGHIIGTWTRKSVKSKPVVTTTTFAAVPARTQRAIEAAAERHLAFVNTPAVEAPARGR